MVLGLIAEFFIAEFYLVDRGLRHRLPGFYLVCLLQSSLLDASTPRPVALLVAATSSPWQRVGWTGSPVQGN